MRRRLAQPQSRPTFRTAARNGKQRAVLVDRADWALLGRLRCSTSMRVQDRYSAVAVPAEGDMRRLTDSVDASS